MVRSVIDTSQSDVLIYKDSDDESSNEMLRWSAPRIKVHNGERRGPAASANWLVQQNPDYDVYGFLTDDCVVTIPGWDKWVMESIDYFPKRLGVISAHHDLGDHVDWPFVSREWINVVGWYACPEMHHQCWPIIHGLIGEMTRICHAPLGSFHVDHDYEAEGYRKNIEADSRGFFEYVAHKLPPIVYKLRNAMA